MKITHVEVWQAEYGLIEPYTIAYQSYSTAPVVFIRIETNQGVSGFGCASPDDFVTGESASKIHAVLQEHAADLLVGRDPLRINLHRDQIAIVMKDFPGARAAIDIALFDLLGKHCNLPVWRLLGGFRTHIKTSMTIGIKPLDETIHAAKEKVAAGFTSLKLKGGSDLEEDIEKVMQVRSVLGPKIEIRFDANQGFNVKQTLDFVDRTRSANITIIEQPVNKAALKDLAHLTKHTTVSIMADESVLGLMDAFAIARHSMADMLNIKLMKCGGISEAAQINAVALSAGVPAMVGCMDEVALGISAGLAFALAYKNVAYADLDSHLEIIDDPTAGAVRLVDGCLYPNDRPGFGADI